MKFLLSLLFSVALFGQTTEPVVGTVTIPAGTFQAPITVVAPLQLNGAQISCPTCGSSGGTTTTVSGLLPWNPVPSLPPTLASWTRLDGYGTGQVSDVTGGVFVQTAQGCPSGFGCFHGLYLAAPVGSFTLTTHENAFCPTNNSWPEAGIFLGDTGTKLVSFGLKNASPIDHVYYWAEAAETTWGTEAYASTPLGQMTDVWQRIQFDGTNFTFSLSSTGADAVSWIPQVVLPANAFLGSTPAKIGFYTLSPPSGLACNATLNYWNLTAP